MTASSPPPSSPSAASFGDVIAKRLASHRDVDFAYLFGSIAKGRSRAASDVDVAIHFGGIGSPGERLDRALALEALLERSVGRTVQISVLNDAPVELRYNVLAHGRLLITHDDDARRAFYVNTGRHYYDMAPAREIARRYQARRIREGTFGG